MNKQSWQRGVDRLKAEWNENPMLVLTVFGIAAGGTAKLIDAASSAQSRRAYAKQVDYRVKQKS